ncbi:MAG: RHS repeat-associated core domain-containing protein [Kiloniellaceae bacterium]
MNKLVRRLASALIASFFGCVGVSVAPALAQLGTPLAMPATEPAAPAPDGAFTPNMLNMQALPVPYARAERLLAARPQPRTAAPVVSGGRAQAAPGMDRTGTVLTQSLTLGCTPPAAAPELVELARALKYDPDLIYEYVYNNIQTLPRYGSVKGPLGTLIDGTGGPFDQAELMFVLLQQSCYTPTYRLGQIHLTSAQYTNWLGTDTGFYSIANVLGQGGFPAQLYGTYEDVADIVLGWAWVRVTIDGTNYVFDPSTKTYDRQTGISNLASAMGYSQSSLISDTETGAIINPTNISGLNRTALRNNLADYANNLVSYIRSNDPTATAGDIIGGATIEPLTVGMQLRQTSLPHAYGTVTNRASLPSQYRTTMKVSVPGASAVTFNSSDIYGQRLSLFFNSSNRPVLRLNGVVKKTGSAVSQGAAVGIGITVTHPYASTAYNQTGTLNVISGAAGSSSPGRYLISTGWGPVNRAMIEKHRKLLAENQAALPGNPGDETVLGESLSIIGYTWLAELARVQSLTDQIAGTATLYRHAVGIVGMRTVGSSEGPFVDLPMNALSTAQRINRPSTSGRTPTESAAFFTNARISSILESGTIEQTQPGSIAVSTVKLFDIASQTDTIFDINNSAVSGNDATYYTNTIRPQLATSYSPGDLAHIDSMVNDGNRVIAPLNGAMSVNLWTGTGYFVVRQNGTGLGAVITGGLNGGYAATNVTSTQTTKNQAPLTPTTTTTPPGGSQTAQSSANSGVYAIGASSSATEGQVGSFGDPVNRVNGNYIYNHTDLTVGSGEFPYGLSFSRVYDSGLRLQSRSLGLGWTDDFAITARADSDGFTGMGAASPIDGAAAIVAIYVVQDLLNAQTSNAKPLDRMVIASMVERWLMDSLIDNVVVVSQPQSSERFIKLADGSYNPPLGSANSLSDSGGTYVYTTKQQVMLSFDSSGNLTSWQYPSGPTVTLTYSGGKLASVSNDMGRALNLTYAGDQLASVSDGTGRSVSYSYDGDNNLTAFTDAAGNITTYAYDIPGRLTQIFYPSKPTNAYVTNNYDVFDRPSTQQDANGNTTTYYFAGTRTELEDAVGTPHVLYFSPRGKLLTEIDGLGNQTFNTYDGRDRLISATLPEGNNVAYTYDDKNNLLTITVTPKPGSPLSPSVQTFTYDATYNKVHTEEDANSNITTYDYDSSTGNLLTVTHPPVGGQTPTESFTYNGRGQRLTHTDAEGKVTNYTYNTGTEALISVIDDYGTGRLNLTSSYGYDTVGNITSITDANGHTTTKQHDTMRRVTQITAPSPFGYVTTYTHDEDGNLVTVVNDPGTSPHLNQTTTYTYTNSFKKETETGPLNHTTTYAYDALDRVSSVTDPESRVTIHGYDVMGRRTSITNTAIQSTPLVQYSYTANGKQETLTDANSNITSYSYDGLDRLAEIAFADASTESYAYDAIGNQTGKTTRSGNTIAYTYDTLDRLSTRAPQGGATVTYAYDLTGRVSSVSDINGAFSYGYDTAGRQASETRPDNKEVSYQYDDTGNITRLTWPDGYYVSYAYDALNRMTEVLENGTTSLANYDYDAASRRTDLDYGNGASATYAYAANGNLTGLTQSFTGSSVTFTYGYNDTDQRTSVNVSDGAYLYHPAAASAVAYTPNSVNQYSTVGSSSLTYDGNGNLTGDGVDSFSYDTENRLVSASALGNTIAYAYDPLDRRASKTVNGTVTEYLSADDQEIAEYDGSGTLLRRYVYGPGLDEPVTTIDASSGTKAYNHQDGLGSVIALSDGAAGSVTDTYAYSPYGQSATLAGSAFRFTGRRLDAESGLYYYRARYYSPALGRFLQTDPSGTLGGINLYAYVENDPLNLVDPSGLWAVDVDILFFGGSFGIGEESGQPFYKWRAGLKLAGGISYDPTADIPIGKSGQFAGQCTYCKVSSVKWESVKAYVGASAGPAKATLVSSTRDAIVNEYDQSGRLLSSIAIPDTVEGRSLKFSGKLGLSISAGVHYEQGASIPWPTFRNFFGQSSLNTASWDSNGRQTHK